MDFLELVSITMQRLNLTSDDAKNRVGDDINRRYKRLTASIGMITSRRVTQDITPDPLSSDLPDVTITGMEKVLKITISTPDGRVRLLEQSDWDEINNEPFRRQIPRQWAVKKMGPGEVIITLQGYPDSPDTTTLHVEGYDIADVLSGSLEPYLPTDFHDILIEGAMSDELRKMEKPELAQMAEQKYEQGLSDLRMFIAKNAYQDIIQGKDKGVIWHRSWFARFTA
jgi:hypothetical protein